MSRLFRRSSQSLSVIKTVQPRIQPSYFTLAYSSTLSSNEESSTITDMGKAERGSRRGGRGGGGGGDRGGRGGRSFRGGRGGGASRAEHPSGHVHMNSQPQPRSDLPRTTTPPLTEAPPADGRLFSSLQNVHPQLVQTITQTLGFTTMTPVQAATLDDLLPPHRSDALVQAKTGTGKTMAFLLPAVQTMITMNRPPQHRGVSVLVISPTRELAMQIEKEANKLLTGFASQGYKVRHAIGGTNKNSEETNLFRGCDVLVATPGRLLDHLSNERVHGLLQHVDTIVLDEADRLLDMGFLPDIKKIVNHLPPRSSPQTNRQGLLFSATVPDRVQHIADFILGKDHKFISTIPKGEVNTHERVPQVFIEAPSFSLTAATMVGAVRAEIEVVKSGGNALKAIVFCPTARVADFYGKVLQDLPDVPNVSILHSRLSQGKRTKITADYRAAKTAVLVTTDVIARGIDFPDVTSVFQVGIPADKETYIHRLGRTARAGATGRGIFILSPQESFFARNVLKDITFTPQQADTSSSGEVAIIAASMDDASRAQVYQSWLGYYKTFMKSLGWRSPEELVEAANTWAKEGLQAPETPEIARKTVGKMGLKGVRGLNVVANPPQEGGGGGGRGGRGGGGRGRGR